MPSFPTTDERARLWYLRWTPLFATEKPYQIVSENMPAALASLPKENLTMEQGPEQTITDIRGREADFDTDEHGFAVAKWGFPRDIDYASVSEVEGRYREEVERMLRKTVGGVDEVVCFNWKLRENAKRSYEPRLANMADPAQPLVPAHDVHVDQSPATAIQYVYECMGDKAEEYLRYRVRIFNIWRPYTSYPVSDCPVAVSDGSTHRPEDLIVCDNIQKSKASGETLLPLYSPNIKWYYLSKQTQDESLIIKIFDSDPTVTAPCCPHTAFEHSNVPVGTPLRKSIEMRVLVFTKPGA